MVPVASVGEGKRTCVLPIPTDDTAQSVLFRQGDETSAGRGGAEHARTAITRASASPPRAGVTPRSAAAASGTSGRLPTCAPAGSGIALRPQVEDGEIWSAPRASSPTAAASPSLSCYLAPELELRIAPPRQSAGSRLRTCPGGRALALPPRTPRHCWSCAGACHRDRPSPGPSSPQPATRGGEVAAGRERDGGGEEEGYGSGWEGVAGLAGWVVGGSVWKTASGWFL